MTLIRQRFEFEYIPLLQPTEIAGEFNVGIVQPKFIPSVWGAIVPILEESAASWNKGHTLESLYHSLIQGRIGLLLAQLVPLEIKLVIIYEVHEFPNGKVLKLPMVAGTGLKEALPKLVPAVQNLAQMYSASSIQVQGRKGLGRLLAPYGYKVSTIVFETSVEKKEIH